VRRHRERQPCRRTACTRSDQGRGSIGVSAPARASITSATSRQTSSRKRPAMTLYAHGHSFNGPSRHRHRGKSERRCGEQRGLRIDDLAHYVLAFLVLTEAEGQRVRHRHQDHRIAHLEQLPGTHHRDPFLEAGKYSAAVERRSVGQVAIDIVAAFIVAQLPHERHERTLPSLMTRLCQRSGASVRCGGATSSIRKPASASHWPEARTALLTCESVTGDRVAPAGPTEMRFIAVVRGSTRASPPV
jgi:hypothetical protein